LYKSFTSLTLIVNTLFKRSRHSKETDTFNHIFTLSTLDELEIDGHEFGLT